MSKDWWSDQDYLVPDILAAGVGVNIYDGIDGFICNFIGQEVSLLFLFFPFLFSFLFFSSFNFTFSPFLNFFLLWLDVDKPIDLATLPRIFECSS